MQRETGIDRSGVCPRCGGAMAATDDGELVCPEELYAAPARESAAAESDASMRQTGTDI